MAITTFAERLNRALDVSGKDRHELAKMLRSSTGRLGVSNSAVGQLLDGSSKSMTAENCARAARFLGVSHYWLATGDGPMKESGMSIAAEQSAPFVTPSLALEVLERALRDLPDPLRGPLADLLGGWARSGGGAEYREPVLAILTSPHGKRRAVA